MKETLKYILIFIVTIFILFIALVVSSKIPHSAIEENLKESIEFYKKNAGIHRIKRKQFYSYIHYFADTRKLNIIYCLDSNNALESVLWSKYYKDSNMDSNQDFIKLVEKSKEPNNQYLRYWNGCMLILRPLLIVLNMEQIYLINKIILAILTLVLLCVLFKKSKKIAMVFLIALILVASWYVSYCIEYSVTFYIMITTIMIALKIDNKENNDSKLLKLFLITGIITCFFDFLTTEILTIFVPLIIILAVRWEEGRLEKSNKTFKFILKACFFWLLGYLGAWLSKWILASLILHINALEYVKENIALRINGLQGLENHEELYNQVIQRNIFTIPLMYQINTIINRLDVKIAIVMIIFFILIFTNWKELKNKKYICFFVGIGIMPYIRYLILANHSYRHVMFTFRDQIITIMVLIYIIIDCFNYKLLFKRISIKSILKNTK